MMLENALTSHQHQPQYGGFGGGGFGGFGSEQIIEERRTDMFGDTEITREVVERDSWGRTEVRSETIDRDMFGNVEVREEDDFFG